MVEPMKTQWSRIDYSTYIIYHHFVMFDLIWYDDPNRIFWIETTKHYSFQIWGS
jgi:hypothetical protein